MKYAVGISLAGPKYADGDVGTLLERVLKYWTLRDKFTGIDPALANIGIKRVIWTHLGLRFIR